MKPLEIHQNHTENHQGSPICGIGNMGHQPAPCASAFSEAILLRNYDDVDQIVSLVAQEPGIVLDVWDRIVLENDGFLWRFIEIFHGI